jgi:serine/threonine-protein kinase RsbT
MPSLGDETVPVSTDGEVVMVRQRVRAWAAQLGFSLVEQTKLVTAASELARNVLVHGGGGMARIQALNEGPRKVIKLTFEDRGPGIADLSLAMRDGYSSTGGLGLGLGGAKRLSNEFDIVSKPGEGTRVTIARWR